MKPIKPEYGQSLALVRKVAHCPDPVTLFAAMTQGEAIVGSGLLETAEVSGKRTGIRGGRSIVVARSALHVVSRGPRVTVRALNENGKALLPWLAQRITAADELRHEAGAIVCEFASRHLSGEDQRLKAPSPMNVLRALLTLNEASGQETAMPLLVGSFAYDLIDRYERLPEGGGDLLGWPDLELWLPDRLVWLDHVHRQATIVAHIYGGGDFTREYGEATAAIVKLAQVVEREPPSPAASAPVPASVASEPAVDLSDGDYAELVRRLKRHITAGDLFQIVPSRTFSVACPDPLAAYRQLRALNPSPYMYYLYGSEGILLGSSPETAVKVDGNTRKVHIRPIAGTRPRGHLPGGELDLDLDSRQEAELRLDEKELAEHMMLVDLARNDVARISEPGTRSVDRLLEVERYSHVMHLVSHVCGILREDLDPLHAYVATMNMGTLTGAPKVKAAELLRRYEKTQRGPYGGAVGYVTADGSLDSAIVIRSAVVRDGVAHVRAGAGVVYDSDPEAEAEETARKARAVISAIDRAHRGEEVLS